MKLSNLELNVKYKNYKELCKILNEPVKTGNAKQIQLKNWSRYFQYHKEGNKFIIDKIYNVPTPPKVRNSKYIQEIQDILMYYLKNKLKHKKSMTLTIGNLIVILGFANSTYHFANYKTQELSELLHIDTGAVYYFYNNSRKEFKRIIDRALKNLQKRNVIDYKKTFLITRRKNGKLITKEATKNEVELIKETMEMLLKDMGLKDYKELYLRGYNTYKEFNKNLMAEIDRSIVNIAIGYNITPIADIKADSDTINKEKQQLNKKSIARLQKLLYIKRQEDIQNRLINTLVSLENYNPNLNDNIQDLFVKHEKEYKNNVINSEIKLKELQDKHNKREEINSTELFNYTQDRKQIIYTLLQQLADTDMNLF